LVKLYGKGNLPFIDGIKIEAFDYPNDLSVKASICKEGSIRQFTMKYEKYKEYMLVWCVE
jgi:hypothetical protein